MESRENQRAVAVAVMAAAAAKIHRREWRDVVSGCGSAAVGLVVALAMAARRSS